MLDRALEAAGIDRRATYLTKVMATVHPSSILRQTTDTDRAREMNRFIADLRVAARWLDGET